MNKITCIEKKLRLWIADLLNRREDTCWAELVLWAVGDRNRFDIMNWKRYTTQSCRLNAKEGEYAYCGKCEIFFPDEFGTK